MKIVFVFLFCSLATGWTAELPKEIHTCSKTDPLFSDCLAKNMGEALQFLRPGYKPLGVPVLDPFYVEKMEIKSSQTGSVHLDQTYEHIQLYGFATDVVFKNMKIDHDKCLWEFDTATPMVRMESDYELQGQILVFPINGHGKNNVTMKNIHSHFEIFCEKYEKKNKKYLKVTNVKLTMAPENVNFYFENIIPGNEQASKEVLNAVNENSDSVFKDVKGAVEELFGQIYKKSSNNVFSRLSESEIFRE